MIPIIAIRLPEKDPETDQRLYDSAYMEDGRPPSACGCPMEYIETDPEQDHLLQCTPDGCRLEESDGVTTHRNEHRYVKPEGRLLQIVDLLPRCSEAWKIEYNKRPTVERYFSIRKHIRLMDQHRYFNIYQMSLHAALQMLTYLGHGTPPSRRLRPHAAHANQAAEGAAQGTGTAAGEDLQCPRLHLMRSLERRCVVHR